LSFSDKSPVDEGDTGRFKEMRIEIAQKHLLDAFCPGVVLPVDEL
jgi:hypothetical protein